jgi:hypothetical protein
MAKKQYVLLESIFNTACIIENEANPAAGGGDEPSSKKGWLASVKDALGGVKNSAAFRINRVKQGYTDSGLGGAGKQIKDMAVSDISKIGSGIKRGALATGGHIKAHKTAYGSGLLGLGAAGAGAYALRDKIAGLLTGHHDDEA